MVNFGFSSHFAHPWSNRRRTRSARLEVRRISLENTQVTGNVDAPFELSAHDFVLQALMLCVGATLHVGCAANWGAGYDEFWHLYYGEVEPFWYFWREIGQDTHPPLTYLLLRPLTDAGADPVWGRLTSLVPGVLSILLMFLVSRAMGMTRAVSHLAAFLLSVSCAAVSMGISVRSYALTTLAVLAAFCIWLRIITRPDLVSRAQLRLFVLACLVAPWSHYAAALPLVGMLALTVWECATCAGFRRSLQRRVRELRPWPETVLLVLGLAAVPVYAMSTRYVGVTNQLSEFLPKQDQGLLDFAVRGINRELSLFLPSTLPEDSLVVPALLALACLAWTVWHTRPRARARDPRRGAAPGILLLILAAILAAAVLKKYPLGGLVRHQYVIFPFLILSGLLVVDLAVRRMRQTSSRWLVCGVLAALSVWSSWRAFDGPRLDDFPHRPPWTAAHRELVDAVTPGETVYVSGFTYIALYQGARDDGGWTWQADLRDSAGGPHEVIQAHLPVGTFRVLRDRSRWSAVAEGDQPGRLRDLMQLEDLRSLWVLKCFQWNADIPRDRVDHFARLRSDLEQAGLSVYDHRWFPRGELFRVSRP